MELFGFEICHARRPGSILKTAIAELFGIQHSIIQGGMHYVASAVSNARGLANSSAVNRTESAIAHV